MAEMDKRYRAFISYSQKDKALAARLHRALETYRLPKGSFTLGRDDPTTRRLGRFFRDDEEMGAVTDLGAALRGAIADAENLIVICSPNAAKSKWVNEEIIHFKRTGREDHIFAVIAAGDPSASDQEDCFPPALRWKVGQDGELSREAVEPLALDVRKEPFARLVARLASGLVNLPFDLLWRRERRRRLFRTLVTVSAAATAFVVLGAAASQNIWRPRLDNYTHYKVFAHSTAELRVAAAGSTFQDCRSESSNCPVMIVVEGGEFMMGASEGDAEASSSELPRHRVSIPRVAISAGEVTSSEWEACLAHGGCEGVQPETLRRGPNLPMVQVSWNDAQRYVRWLSDVTGQRYRLLTEAEWEFVARAGSTTRYFWGDNSAPNGRANCSSCYPRPPEFAVAARSFRPNSFGIYDTAGNAAEWVEDCYHASYTGAPSDGRAWVDQGEINTVCARVARGGSWGDGAYHIRSSERSGFDVRERSNFLGFRIARELYSFPAAPSAPHVAERVPSLSDPVEFVRGLYAEYGSDQAPNRTYMSSSVSDPSLLELLLQAERVGRREGGIILDADPLCACQDPDGLRVAQVAVLSRTAESAHVRATLGYFGEANSDASTVIDFQLVVLGGQWRIHDVGSEFRPSLREFLRENIVAVPDN